MYAYNEDYISDTMVHMGEMLDYAVYDLKYDLKEFWKMFCISKIGEAFQMGHPKYTVGMSGVELARDVVHEFTGEYINTPPSRGIDCSKEYWTGWVLAYYQWYRNISFNKLRKLGLSAEEVIQMYILHEADIQKFVDCADQIIMERLENTENQLKRLRVYASLTQKQLSEKSGVSLRMIQLYEQGQNDLSKAQASVVISLAQALRCKVTDLVGVYNIST